MKRNCIQRKYLTANRKKDFQRKILLFLLITDFQIRSFILIYPQCSTVVLIWMICFP